MFTEEKIGAFTDVLASKESVPGGGGASALVGAVGAALASMVGNLTVGKKKYAAVEEDVKAVMAQAETLRQRLQQLMDEDAAAFEPLAKAYGIPKDDPDRDAVMEQALHTACEPPMEMMRAISKVIELHDELAEKGSVIVRSDVGVGVVCCKAALQGASLNVFINTKSMKDRAHAEALEAEADQLLARYVPLAEDVYARIVEKLR